MMSMLQQVAWFLLVSLSSMPCHAEVCDLEEMETRVICLESVVDELLSEVQNLSTRVSSNARLTGDCQDLYGQGIGMNGPHLSLLSNGQNVNLLCDMTHQHQWTILQKRTQGGISFRRTYAEYQKGFGKMTEPAEFWLGLDAMHQLTSRGNHVLHVELTNWDGVTHYAQYSRFSIRDSEDGYRLHLGDYSGTAGDSLGYNDGMRFSTYDRDQDARDAGNCALMYGSDSGWWYNDCSYSNLNGEYRSPPHHQQDDSHQGIYWVGWRGWDYVYKTSVMKMRRTSP